MFSKMVYKRNIDDYWSFRTADTKEFTHCYHNYPAMMIPQVARKLLEDYAPEGKLELVFDPYSGSGTTLVESSLKGIRSVGTDLNPLAVFMGRVKNTHYDVESIDEAMASIQAQMILYAPDRVVDTDFSRISNHTFWYSEDSLYRLSYINQLIRELNPTIQDFFLLCLSETVREVSFTRNGEFKRYRMSEKQLEKFNPDVFGLFTKKVQRNMAGLAAFDNATDARDLATVHGFDTSHAIPSDILEEESVDMVITSPPYGDSHTTVAYGQFSRWANEWFDFDNAKSLDRLLMGGVISKEVRFETESIRTELQIIKDTDEKRYFEVVSFLNDYWASIRNVAKVVRRGGRVCYVVGNRRVKNTQINLDYFTAEMFEKCGFRHEVTIVREIPNKRMPSKNSPTNKTGEKSATMTNEYIVILTKL